MKTALQSAICIRKPTQQKHKNIPADLQRKILEKKRILKEYKRTLAPATKTALNQITKNKILKTYSTTNGIENQNL